ncbi:MAG: hypothetical protein M3Y69_07530, partial [Verrucomicrobiota bacterium]|nr:hypothetical protein [Verrucomicrobiota bacterium]
MRLVFSLLTVASIGLSVVERCPASAAQEERPFGETQESLGPKTGTDFDEDDAIENVAALKFEGKAGLGYRSNIFEVNEQHDSPLGDWFSDVALDVAMPVPRLPEGSSIRLVSFWKRYFRQHSADEYLIRGDVQWSGRLSDSTALSIGGFGGRFQEGQFFQFSRVIPQAQVGWVEGARLNTRSKLSETLQLTTEASTEYRLFTAALEDNLQDTANVELARAFGDGLTATIAGELHDAHYRHRPPEDEGRSNPAHLDTVEARLLGRLKWAFDPVWTMQGELSAGPNSDVTNGYYDARVAAAGFELRYKKTPWEISLVTEPEVARFSQRPSN